MYSNALLFGVQLPLVRASPFKLSHIPDGMYKNKKRSFERRNPRMNFAVLKICLHQLFFHYLSDGYAILHINFKHINTLRQSG